MTNWGAYWYFTNTLVPPSPEHYAQSHSLLAILSDGANIAGIRDGLPQRQRS